MKKQFNPTVFIGMPVFNSETTIRKTLESIVSQDYDEWKLFISDNSSSDMTRKICEHCCIAGKSDVADPNGRTSS